MKVAIAQASPAPLDLAGSIDKACAWIARAKADLIAFPETWVPCYPIWCDGGTLGKWGHEPAKKAHARLFRNSLEVPSKETRSLCRAARKAGSAVVIGINERSGSTLYNSILFISPQGEIAGVHRKLVPTFGERLVWGYGDASGLRAYEFGAKVGGLVCWEHWMPLARHVLHEAGEQVHVALWPSGKEAHQIASRHYAFEGRAFVLSACSVMKKSDFPRDFELLDDVTDLIGGSAIVGPDGAYIAGPVFDREELVAAEIDLERIIEEKQTLDVAGHYSRPDVFSVSVASRPRPAPAGKRNGRSS